MRRWALAGLVLAVVCTTAVPQNQTTLVELNTTQHRRTAYSRIGYFETRNAPASDAIDSSRRSGAPREPVLTGRRDPFRLPPPPGPNSRNKDQATPYLPPGAAGLLIDQLTLKGVLWNHSRRTLIAIVTNKTQRAYFLRLNERVYDGIVTQITPDAIYFAQRVLTSRGESSLRPVVKQLTASEGGSHE
jgi:hypothetical protein